MYHITEAGGKYISKAPNHHQANKRVNKIRTCNKHLILSPGAMSIVENTPALHPAKNN